MVADDFSRIRVRDATDADVPALTAIKGPGTAALHRDRLRDAHGSGLRYMVLVADDAVIGCACLVLRRPASWSDANDPHHLPQIVDLRVMESHRGQGYGSAFMWAMERIAADAGYRHLYLSVDPVHHPRAYALYQRLGYQPVQAEPYREEWEYHDSGGRVYRGAGWAVDMVQPLDG